MTGRRERWQVWAAEAAGRLLGNLGRGVPGVVGPLLVAVGLALAWLPLGVVAAGVILWALDWRIPSAASKQPRADFGDGRDRLRAVS